MMRPVEGYRSPKVAKYEAKKLQEKNPDWLFQVVPHVDDEVPVAFGGIEI